MESNKLRLMAPGCLVLLGLAYSPFSQAGEFEDKVAEGREAIAKGNAKSALKLLSAAEDAAPNNGVLVSTNDLARFWYYQGVGYHLKGDKKGRDMTNWRQALLMDLEFQWEEDLLQSEDAQALFEALRKEVGSRSRTDVGVPEKTGASTIHVDGERKRTGDEVRKGTHLGQIVCDDSSVHGKWTNFSSSVDWFSLCPNGVDTTVVVAKAEEEEND